MVSDITYYFLFSSSSLPKSTPLEYQDFGKFQSSQLRVIIIPGKDRLTLSLASIMTVLLRDVLVLTPLFLKHIISTRVLEALVPSGC